MRFSVEAEFCMLVVESYQLEEVGKLWAFHRSTLAAPKTKPTTSSR